jgi:hypothetical protein
MVEPLAGSWENSEFHRVAGLDSETSAMASRRRTWMETPTQIQHLSTARRQFLSSARPRLLRGSMI